MMCIESNKQIQMCGWLNRWTSTQNDRWIQNGNNCTCSGFEASIILFISSASSCQSLLVWINLSIDQTLLSSRKESLSLCHFSSLSHFFFLSLSICTFRSITFPVYQHLPLFISVSVSLFPQLCLHLTRHSDSYHYGHSLPVCVAV